MLERLARELAEREDAETQLPLGRVYGRLTLQPDVGSASLSTPESVGGSAMFARFRPHLNHATVVAYLALFVALGGGALAARSFVGSDGQINGCVSRKGQLTVLKPGKKCTKGQAAIAWNQRGAKGNPGAPGTPGPTASSFASFSPSSPVAIDPAGVSVPVMSLTDGTNGGLITTTFSGRILVNASISLATTTAAAERMFCDLEVAPTGAGFTRIGKMASILMTDSVEMPLTGAANEPAGTYNVRIVCLRNGPAPVDFGAGDMTAWATAG